MRTDGVHCRESVGIGLVVLKLVPVPGAAFSGITMNQLMCASLFPHPLYYYWYVLDMFDTESSCWCTHSAYGPLTEETTVTQHVSHRPIKCQYRSWSQRGTKVIGSHHGDNPYSNQQGSKSRRNLCQVQPTVNIGNSSASRRCLWVRNTVSTAVSGVRPVFQNPNYKLQRRPSDVLPHPTKSSKVTQYVF